MSLLWDCDLEKGPHKSIESINYPPDPSSLPQDAISTDVKIPLPCSPPGEELQLLDYGDRLVSNYLGPRPHPMFNNMNYDVTIIQAARFRHLNIARIQHDLLRLQNMLTSPGGGTEENFARLSSLLQEHTTAMRDWEFVFNSTIKIDHHPRYMENLLSQYPEIPWHKNTPPHRLAYLRYPERAPRDLIASLGSMLPRSWRWSRKERKLRPESYKLYLEGISGVEPQHPSLILNVMSGAIISLASSTLILIPTVILSFQLDRVKSFITIAVAVTCFGFCLFVGARTTSSETFLATATYAAILVVFVGTNNSINS